VTEPAIAVDTAPGVRAPEAAERARAPVGAGSDLARQLGAALIEARGAESRRAFAARVDLHPNTLREFELGTGNPTLRKATEVAALYGLTLRLEVVR
jgi:DNA-binding XRE family transcriptional regulator